MSEKSGSIHALASVMISFSGTGIPFCWREKCTQRRTHSKPNKAGFTRAESERRASQFFLKINKRQSS
jgi:hypothetical protein